MKQISSFILFATFMSISLPGLCQKSTSGYILFGKNKESSTACSQSGICKLQQMLAEDYIPVSFIIVPFNEAENEYTITLQINLETLKTIQPNQIPYFVDAKEPYMVSTRFTLPPWLVSGLGFEPRKNKFVSIPAPFSMGIPSAPDHEGNVTLTLAEKIKLVP